MVLLGGGVIIRGVVGDRLKVRGSRAFFERDVLGGHVVGEGFELESVGAAVVDACEQCGLGEALGNAESQAAVALAGILDGDRSGRRADGRLVGGVLAYGVGGDEAGSAVLGHLDNGADGQSLDGDGIAVLEACPCVGTLEGVAGNRCELSLTALVICIIEGKAGELHAAVVAGFDGRAEGLGRAGIFCTVVLENLLGDSHLAVEDLVVKLDVLHVGGLDFRVALVGKFGSQTVVCLVVGNLNDCVVYFFVVLDGSFCVGDILTQFKVVFQLAAAERVGADIEVIRLTCRFCSVGSEVQGSEIYLTAVIVGSGKDRLRRGLVVLEDKVELVVLEVCLFRKIAAECLLRVDGQGSTCGKLGMVADADRQTIVGDLLSVGAGIGRIGKNIRLSGRQLLGNRHLRADRYVGDGDGSAVLQLDFTVGRATDGCHIGSRVGS